MKYWAYLVAKLVAAGGLLWGLRRLLLGLAPVPETFMYVRPRDPFAQDLAFTFLMLLHWLFAVGLVWLIVWDQRYRCRTCLRWLRMPLRTGSWTHVLFGAPRTEYICLYGHGTLKVDELQISGQQMRDWEPHEDIWKELFSLEETKK
jgi:hypothetical protein